MLKKVFMSFVALVAIAAAATGPARAQNATTYNVTFGGFSRSYMNTTVSVPSLPQTFTQIDGYNFNPWQVISGDGSEFTGASVSGGEGKVSANIVDWGHMTITVTGTFEGTATIHVTGIDDNDEDISRDITVSCVAPPQPRNIRLAEGTEDAAHWQGKVGENGSFQAFPLEELNEGTPVYVKYTGTRKVKSVVATVVPAAPAALTLNLTSPTVGQVIGSDGKNYAYASLPTGVTALARICYVNGSNGLAMAMADEGQMAWSAAITTCEAHTPAFANGTWKLPTKAEWDNMISAAGGISTLREAFSGIGGDNLQYVRYWSATEDESNDSNAYNILINDGTWATFVKTNVYRYVRAVLAW